MTTMLTRASHAVEDALASDNNHPDDIARAVLMAVRDLDRDVVGEARKATVDVGGNMADFLGASEWQVSGSFARAIDAILSETP